jgi:hypothetical protein
MCPFGDIRWSERFYPRGVHLVHGGSGSDGYDGYDVTGVWWWLPVRGEPHGISGRCLL